jgi:phosphoglycerate dehydrogenase-like enzyme
VTRHKVWFERPVDADLADLIPDTVEVISPTGDDHLDGLDRSEAIIASLLTYDDAIFALAPGVQVLARTGIGYDTVDVPAASARGILVCNTPEGPTVSTAEHAVMLILAVAKNLPESVRRLRRAEGDYYGRHGAVELDGKTLGLVGYGRIARRVGAACAALGMKVIAYDRLAPEGDGRAAMQETFRELLERADVVSVHVPLTAETRHMFDDTAFASMRDRSIFVNTSRGGVADQAALLRAVDSGRLHGVGLDVTDPEPLDPDHPLLHHPSVIVTPHVASGTREGRRRIFQMAVQQVVDVLEGRRPAHPVNPEVSS